jgi:hypothetical protein
MQCAALLTQAPWVTPDAHGLCTGGILLAAIKFCAMLASVWASLDKTSRPRLTRLEDALYFQSLIPIAQNWHGV